MSEDISDAAEIFADEYSDVELEVNIEDSDLDMFQFSDDEDAEPSARHDDDYFYPPNEWDDIGDEQNEDSQPEPPNQFQFRKNAVFNPTDFYFETPASFLRPESGVTARSVPLEIFKKFFDSSILQQIVIETNRFIEHVQVANPTAMKKWKVVSVEELWRFFGLNVLMGVSQKPAISDYWSTDPLLFSPAFGKVMSRNRFQEILRGLHFVNNSAVPSTNINRFVKLGGLMELVTNNFQAAVNPGLSLTVDETLLGWKGRLSFKQYLPLKASQSGIKQFVLCDAEYKYALKILPYPGKSTEIGDRDLINELGFGGAAVMSICEGYLDRGHQLTIDNWFMSPNLAYKLHDAHTHVLGTVQKRRKRMPTFGREKLPVGSVETYCNSKILVERWSDRREVMMLNSFIPHGMQEVQSTNPNNARKKPLSVLHYNKTMGALDNIDRTIKPYQSCRKTFKWYKKVFFNLFDMALYNSFVLFCYLRAPCDRPPFKKFQLDFVRNIFNAHASTASSAGRPSQIPIPTRLTGTHLPEKVLKYGMSNFSDCHLCKRKGKRKATAFKCKTCQIRLCIDSAESCFYLFHTTRSLPGNERPPRCLIPVAMESQISTAEEVQNIANLDSDNMSSI